MAFMKKISVSLSDTEITNQNEDGTAAPKRFAVPSFFAFIWLIFEPTRGGYD